MAARTPGALTMPPSPRSPSITNQNSMNGPKIRPIQPVPMRWTENKATRMTSVIGTT
jgi:hypothetical protein